jgi:hypothetical protein
MDTQDIESLKKTNAELLLALRQVCGRTTGHGMACSPGGYECRACAEKARAADRIEELERQLIAASQAQSAPGSAPDGALADKPLYSTRQKAARYEWLRDWYLRDGRRAEINPNGHIQITTPEMVDAAIDAHLAGRPAAANAAGQVPDGWKLVPVEPTVEMRNACYEEYHKSGATYTSMCRAIVAAAPDRTPAADAGGRND